MAEQTEQVNATLLQRLQERQEAVLSKLGAFQLRLNRLQRQSDLPYDTSNVSLSEFQRLKSRQNSIFDRLVGIAADIEQTARRQDIVLPAQNEVISMMKSMADNLAKRQQRSLNQLRILGKAARSIQELQVTPQIKRFMESKDEKKVNSLSSSPLSKLTFKSRIFEIESVVECLRTQCRRMDVQQNGTLTVDQMMNILDTVSMMEIDGSVHNEAHITLILEEMSVDSRTDYNSFLDHITDCEGTDKLKSALLWNRLRLNLVGRGRVDGSLRILYRYDGWPEPQTILISPINTRSKHKVKITEILEMLRENTESVEYHELRYASKLSHFEICNEHLLVLLLWLLILAQSAGHMVSPGLRIDLIF